MVTVITKNWLLNQFRSGAKTPQPPVGHPGARETRLAYVWLPLTSKPPSGSALTVPVEVVPSPHSMVAVKSPTDALGLMSVNVATTPESALPAVAASWVPLAAMVGGAE